MLDWMTMCGKGDLIVESEIYNLQNKLCNELNESIAGRPYLVFRVFGFQQLCHSIPCKLEVEVINERRGRLNDREDKSQGSNLALS